MNNQKRYHNGQSLVEVLVATGVVLVLVTGLVAATTASLKTNQNAKLRTQALSLTKEGMEIVRRTRDMGNSVFAFSGTYCLDIGSSTLEPKGADECALDSTVHMRRHVLFENDTFCSDAATCKKVTVTVSWIEGSDTQNTSLSSYLTDWNSR